MKRNWVLEIGNLKLVIISAYPSLCGR
jgi:hypothetical protein